jgi:lysine decarboxylase
MASLDAARRQLAVHGEALLHETLDALKPVKEKLDNIDGIAVVGENVVGTGGIAAHDPLRLVLDTRELGCSGYEVADSLRETYDVHVELATQATIVCVLGLGQSATDLARFAGDVDEIAERLRQPGTVAPISRGPQALKHELAVSPRDAFLGASECVRLDDAVGRISCESIAGYPPGIPALLPGERITADTTAYLREILAAGGRLHGASDPQVRTIHVLAQGSAELAANDAAPGGD